MTEDELKKVARLMLEARIVESIPSKEKITEIVLAEIRRQAYGMYDREARTMSATLVQTEVRAQLKCVVDQWVKDNVLPALNKMRPDYDWLTRLVQEETISIKTHIKQMVREETGRLISQAIGVQISGKVAKLLALFDKVLIQDDN